MRPATQARRRARVQRDRPRLSVGDCALPAARAMGARAGALCAQFRAGEHEQTHHMDALLRAAQISARFRARIRAQPLSRTVRVRTAAVSELGPGASPTVARSLMAPGPTPGGLAVAAQHW